VEIMLKGLKMSLPDIKIALANMDTKPDTGLSIEKLVAIKLNLPTPEELSMIESYEGDKEELGNAEHYFMTVSKIPQLEVRVNSLEYKSTFDQKVKDLSRSLKILLDAIRIVDSNKNFHRLFEIVLAMGNYLNGSTKLGQTHGFKLQSLAKIGDVKSPKNPTISLNNYLAEYLDNAKLLENLKEFSPIHEASRESSTEFGKNVMELSKGIEPINAHLQLPNCDSHYTNTMKSWAADAVKITTDLTQKNQTVIEGIKKVTALFAEPPSTKSEDFFGMISTFISGIEQANIANNKRKAEEAAAQKKTRQCKTSTAGKTSLSTRKFRAENRRNRF